jgi:hypothetical protein
MFCSVNGVSYQILDVKTATSVVLKSGDRKIKVAAVINFANRRCPACLST